LVLSDTTARFSIVEDHKEKGEAAQKERVTRGGPGATTAKKLTDQHVNLIWIH
jgi:hypothetical protein